MAGATVNQRYNIQWLDQLAPFDNRVVSLSLALMGAIHKHPKNCNFFRMQAAILVPIITGTPNNLMPDN